MRQGDSFYQLKKLSGGPPAGHLFSMERVEVGQGGGVTESIGSAGAKLWICEFPRSPQFPARTLKYFGLLWGLDLEQVSLKRVRHTKVIIINKHVVTADHMLSAFFFLLMLSYQVKKSTSQLPLMPEEAIS